MFTEFCNTQQSNNSNVHDESIENDERYEEAGREDGGVARASLPDERWVVKAAGWNPELNTKYKTCRAAGRPKTRCEDELNEFPRPERTEDEISNVERNNNEIKTAKDQEILAKRLARA